MKKKIKWLFNVFLECPCHAECPEGCKDCPHWACSHPCDEPTNYSETEKVIWKTFENCEWFSKIRTEKERFLVLQKECGSIQPM